MNPTRQERKSCEACRARKLRCSGEKSGCSRCRGLSLICRFKDKGAPGRPKKRIREEEEEAQQDCRLPSNREQRTGSSSSENLPSVITPQAAPGNQGVINHNSLMGSSLPCEPGNNCGLDSFDWQTLGSGDIRSFPLELWQASSHQNGLQDSEIAQIPLDPYLSPVSYSQSCKCDEEVSATVRTLSRTEMSHDVIQMLRSGVSLAERLLTCPICYDVSKPPRVTVQNVLLIGHLMFEITSGYQKYLRWLDKYCTDLNARNKRETVYLQDSGYGIPSENLGLQISGDKFQEFVIHGLQADAERLTMLGKKFAQRQRNRHVIGHEACPDAEGRCRKKEQCVDHDPLDLCPQNPLASKLWPCFRIVDEVRGMINEVANSVV